MRNLGIYIYIYFFVKNEPDRELGGLDGGGDARDERGGERGSAEGLVLGRNVFQGD